MKEEAVMGVRTLDTDANMELHVLKARVATFRTQLNLANMLHELPAVIKEVEDRNARTEAIITQMKTSQEKGEI